MVDGSQRQAPRALPVTLRPRNIRVVAYGLAALIIATMVVLAVIMPPDWGVQDRVFLVLLGVAIGGGLHLLARPRLELTRDRVTVVNPVRTHVLVWPEIIDARMPAGEPWPSVDLANGSTLAVMAIQSNDGDLARNNLAEFRRHLHERGEAAEPDRD
ncbi:PH domain-containing protein [Thermobifida halotolerans]|uniref:PH domain-containing protein n=1 Tax=Thermobifida halotolerans TaxID=483545 RepID=A0A399G5V1_9ACTN|nr:PH domain-containing protein [Thermobifida halotolerans]UOE21816.1 PH domain-containing protein [Thermobifida halotolerans]